MINFKHFILILFIFYYGECFAGKLAVTIPGSMVAGDGWKTLQYDPSGNPALLYWKIKNNHPTNLIYLHKNNKGKWEHNTITTIKDNFSSNPPHEPIKDHLNPTLFFDRKGKPNVFLLDGGYSASILHFSIKNKKWKRTVIPVSTGFSDFHNYEYVAFEIDKKGLLHVLFNKDNKLIYGSTKNGKLVLNTAANQFDLVKTVDPNGNVINQGGIQPFSIRSRFISMAIDNDGFAHIVYCPVLNQYMNMDYSTRNQSQLNYATNRNGSWIATAVSLPEDTFSDAGYGGSIAINPITNEPAIASVYISRVATGSANWAQLRFHQKQGATWNTQIIATAADGYTAKDGNKGTGFAPYLKFTSDGTPRIIFSDFATEHFFGMEDEFSGQIRQTMFANNQWQFDTIFKQADPVTNQLLYPTFAFNGNQSTYAGTLLKYSVSENGFINDLTFSTVIVIDTTASDSDRIFNYLEKTYPEKFPANPVSSTLGGYYYRYYSATDSYLATANETLYYRGPDSQNQILSLGLVSSWLLTASGAGF
jgi:hypothetical protein